MSINRISLYHLETLIWISRLGSFAAAAEYLNTTQPTISARINELEDRLAAKLFSKNGRSMTLTPAGRELVRDYLPIWEQLQSTLLRSAGLDRMRGIVRIGAGEIAAATCLPPLIADLKRRWPDLTFEIEIELTAQLIQGLLSGRIDLAFAAGFVAHPMLSALPVGSVELLWVASPAVARRMADAGSEEIFPLWMLPKHSPINPITRNALARLPVGHHSVNLCNNVRTMIDIVTMSDGFALLPKSMIATQLERGMLVPLAGQTTVEPIMFHLVARATESDPVINEILREGQKIRLESDSPAISD